MYTSLHEAHAFFSWPHFGVVITCSSLEAECDRLQSAVSRLTEERDQLTADIARKQDTWQQKLQSEQAQLRQQRDELSQAAAAHRLAEEQLTRDRLLLDKHNAE